MRPIKRYIDNRLMDDYINWQPTLLRELGPFCSFCETPLKNKADIEHKISQSLTKALKEKITNLVLACINCNSVKGTRVKIDNFESFVWPDGYVPPQSNTIPQNSYANKHSLFIYYMKKQYDVKDYDLTHCPVLPEEGGQLTVNQRINNYHKKIIDNLPKNDQGQPNLENIWAIPFPYRQQGDGFILRPQMKTIATNTIVLCGLNYADSETRLLLQRRNRVWDVANGAARIYKTVPDNLKDIFKGQIRLLAASSGFWSIWMTVFYVLWKFSWQDVFSLFVKLAETGGGDVPAYNNWNKGYEIVPGTDIRRVQLDEKAWEHLRINLDTIHPGVVPPVP
ncbi:MAG: HNH endonuclease [Bacteroidota bacterium]